MHREDQFIPELIVRNAHAALDFYQRVFGAEEVHRMLKPGTEKIVHGELILEGHKFFVCDEFPPSEGGTCKSQKRSEALECASLYLLTTRTGSWSVHSLLGPA